MQESERGRQIQSTTILLVIVLTALVAFCEYLSLNRIFQVDEIQNVFTARLLAKHLQNRYSAYASLIFFGPMMWLGGSIDRSALLLRSERLLFFALFWVNIGLIVHCAGIRLRSRRGLLALIIAATIAPFWDYGFEIRHDNALLTTILIAWSAARPLGEGTRRKVFLAAFMAVVGQFIAFKSFVYLVPIVVYAIVSASVEERRPLWPTLAHAAAGAIVAGACGAAIHLLEGTWGLFISSSFALEKSAVQTTRFSALPTLSRLVPESPLLLAAVFVVVALAARRFRPGRAALGRDSLMPEVFLLACAIAALVINPTPFPYNLVLLTPQATVLVLRRLPDALARWSTGHAWQAALSIAFLLHLSWWLLVTKRHLSMSNARQITLMTAAEEMTDPQRDAVFDGSGLVTTRHPPRYHWLIHSLSIGFFRSGQWESIRSQLARGETPVIIPNYRVAALPADDLRFIEAHYVPLAGDFWVAGARLGPGNHEWDCIVPGRYYVTWPVGSGGISVDGRPLARPGSVVLTRGPHAVNAGSVGGWVVWLGPHLNTPPRLGPGRAADVFVNWY